MGAARPELLLIGGALATLVVAGMWLPGPIRVFLVAQSAHWSFSYVARPAVLLWVQPAPQYGDNVPDPRLADLGYDFGIAAVLRPVLFGLWLYAGLVVAYVIWTRLRAPAPPMPASLILFYREQRRAPQLKAGTASKHWDRTRLAERSRLIRQERFRSRIT